MRISSISYVGTHLPRPLLVVVVSTGSYNFSYGQTVSVTPLTVTGGIPPYIYSANTLPSGLSIGSSTGTISGKGNALSGNTAYQIVVTDSTPIKPQTSNANIYISMVATVPCAPSIVSATDVNLTAVQLIYTAPTNNGGYPITSYIATSSPGSIHATLSTAGNGTMTVTGLTTGTTYAFTVAAVNSIGTGQPSACSSSVLVATAPNVVVVGTPIVKQNVGMAIPYTAPNNNGSAIRYFVANANPGGITATLSTSSSGTITVTGLTKGSYYTFTVTATNGVGTSNVSANTACKPYGTVPNAVVISNVVHINSSLGNTAIGVVWNFATCCHTGFTPTAIVATSHPGCRTATVTSSASPTITVTGLTPATTYFFTAYAVNAVGQGCCSTPSGCINTYGPPISLRQPTINTVIPGGSYIVGNAIQVATGANVPNCWSACGPIFGWTYQWFRSCGTSLTSNLAPSTYTPVSGDAGKNVYFVQTAVSLYGFGSTSANSNLSPIIGSSKPLTAPNITSATGQAPSGYANITFTAPTCTGGSTITSYVVQENPQSGTCLSTRFSTISQSGAGTITISGLIPGTTYKFYIVAINSYGQGPYSNASPCTFTWYSPQLSANPSIAGTVRSGSTLTANIGTWASYPAATYANQWYRGSSAIGGATGSTYALTNCDLGSTIKFQVTATNPIGSNVAQSPATGTIQPVQLSLTVNTSAYNFTIGSAYSSTPATASGGFGNITYAISGNTLPTGLTFSNAGLLYGTLTGTTTQTNTQYTITATCSYSTPQHATGTIAITVNAAPLSVSFTCKGTYNLTLNQSAGTNTIVNSVSGGIPPYSYSVCTSLPTGLTFANTYFSGTPTALHSQSFYVWKVSDSTTPTAQSQTRTIGIGVYPAASTITFTTAGSYSSYTWSVPNGTTQASVLAVGAGGGGGYSNSYVSPGAGGGGGAVTILNNFTVAFGQNYTIIVGGGGCKNTANRAGHATSFIGTGSGTVVAGGGGGGGIGINTKSGSVGGGGGVGRGSCGGSGGCGGTGTKGAGGGAGGTGSGGTSYSGGAGGSAYNTFVGIACGGTNPYGMNGGKSGQYTNTAATNGIGTAASISPTTGSYGYGGAGQTAESSGGSNGGNGVVMIIYGGSGCNTIT